KAPTSSAVAPQMRQPAVLRAFRCLIIAHSRRGGSNRSGLGLAPEHSILKRSPWQKSPLPRFQDGQAVRRLCLKWYAFCRQMKVLFRRARHITISTGNQGEDDSSAAHATARKKCAAHLSRTKNHLADNSAHSRPNGNTFLPYDGRAAKSVGGFTPTNNDEVN